VSGVVEGAASAGGEDRDAFLETARRHLQTVDPVIARLIEELPGFDPQAWLRELPPVDLFGALLFQVVGQQLSVAVTRRTIARIEAMFDGSLPSPAALAAADPAALRAAGLSWRKVATLRDLAARFLDGRFSEDVLNTLSDQEIIDALTVVPGIGPWTAQGALILALQRQDVVLPGDLALRKAIQVAYGLERRPTSDEVLAIAEKWRPYRTLATGYLFASAFERSGVSGSATDEAVRPSPARAERRHSV
jgi:DNA-3-methyladenine glycosylase II